ncbi:MAG: TFIIB-type zinc ribbon-containing protein [Candidatus Saliniplasma sp.]
MHKLELAIGRKVESVISINICPECGSHNIVLDNQHGELLCNKCGLVLEELYFYEGDEWLSNDFEIEGDKIRTGPPANVRVFDKGLTTIIDHKDKDSYGKPISKSTRSQLYRLRKWQKRLRASNALEKNLEKAFREIDRIGSVLGLPRPVREVSCSLYKNAVKKNLIRGRNINCIAASCVYTTCKQAGIPRTLKEISEVTLFKKREIGRAYISLCRELKLKIEPVKAQYYIERFCDRLELDGRIQRDAKEIIDKAESLRFLSGKCPSGLAAAAIYIAAKNRRDKITQKKIARVASVTEVTIRNRYKELVEELSLKTLL